MAENVTFPKKKKKRSIRVKKSMELHEKPREKAENQTSPSVVTDEKGDAAKESADVVDQPAGVSVKNGFRDAIPGKRKKFPYQVEKKNELNEVLSKLSVRIREKAENQKSPSAVTKLPTGAKRKAGESLDQVSEEETFQYNMKNGFRGLFLLFNCWGFIDPSLKKRDGTEKDAQLMEETFKQMGFLVYRHDEPTAVEVIYTLKTVAKHDLKHVDCVAIGYLSHGGEKDTLFTHDNPLPFSQLTEPFRMENCHESLRGKPKLFFIKACRGVKVREPVEDMDDNPLPGAMPQRTGNVSGTAGQRNVDGDDESGQENIDADDESGQENVDGDDMPIYEDFLVAWSTAPGCYCLRNRNTGSVFIQNLCTYLKRCYHESAGLLSILRLWKKSCLANKKQMMWYFSKLTKDVFFHRKPVVEEDLLKQTQPNK